jgi:S-DNA-T family DNA segregation ATPase FtsK/SpoIIIE
MGRTSTGQAVHVNLAGNRTPHALISGTTGSGKSVSQRLIAWNLARGAAPNSQQYLLIDGKGGVQWHGFEREAHLAHPIIGDSAQAVRALLYSLCELDRRKATGQRTPQLFVIVDEVKEILDMDPAPVGETIRRIASLGRELGIHLVLSTQYPLVDALGGAIAKANLPLRLTGRVLSAQDAYIATGIKNTGAELLNGNGDFVLAVGSEVYRLQIAMVGDAEIAGLERSTEERHIDLDDPDPQHILNVAGLEPLNPQHIGLALAYGEGIKRLQARLKVGQERATRVREFAAVVQRVLEAHGRRIAPTEGVELQEAV